MSYDRVFLWWPDTNKSPQKADSKWNDLVKYPEKAELSDVSRDMLKYDIIRYRSMVNITIELR